MKPLVSIITTVKNGQNTIEETISSALAQTYSNIELIVVDDGSQDNTSQKLRELTQNNDKLKVITTEGIGRVPALNMAINKSNGTYISNLDADDVIHPDKIRIQIEHMNKYKNLFLVATDSVIVYDDQKVKWDPITYSNNVSEVGPSILYSNVINHSSVVINKEKLKKIGMYNISQKTQVDYELWLRAYHNKMKMDIIHMPLTGKRIHMNQSYENKNRLNYTFKSMMLQLKYLFKQPRYWLYSLIVISSFLLAQLPFSIRRKIRSKIAGKKI